MNQRFEVRFRHSIQRNTGSNDSYTSQTINENTVIVEALSSDHARRMVEAQYGGHQNCAVVSCIPKY